MASSSASLSLSSPSTSLSQNWEHDVFPSFHGPDVRKSFLSHVLKEFRRKAINLFTDNEITRGEFIGPALKHAIRGSKIAIALLSKNYASSSWCLDELVEIMKKESGEMVITIFYEVDPTDVKKQTGDFGEVFKNTCKGKGEEKTEIWRKALEGVATIPGYHSSNWDDEAVMIENIAADISKKLNHLTPSHDFDHLIGMRDHIERMEPFLRLDLDEVRMIGIWGPLGIGKTTIARFLFDQVSSEFQHSAFMVNIKGNYPKPCLDEYGAQLQLENQMLSLMIDEKDIKISHLGVAHGRLRNRKVLLVLDDVDQLAQLYALAKNVKCFGPKSRIIITTEDLRILKAHGIDHIYKVNVPSDDEALQMFCMYAFDQKYPKDGFDVLAQEITYLVDQLPLGLRVMGSHFGGLSKEEWSIEVSRLRTNLNEDTESILKFSYNALCDEDIVVMASSSSSTFSFPSSTLSGNLDHDVFLSFHGPCVRKSFLSHVCKEFESKAINMFIDNNIKRGESIGPEHERAIKGSKIAVVLLSKNYASSPWCLNELVVIMKRESGQMVIPIFYEVDPTDVRKQTGYFGMVFKNTCQGKGDEKIEIWRKALEEVATITGYHKWFNEAVMIGKIAAHISKILNHLTPSHGFDHFIGMEDHMERINPLLRLDSDEVRMIGIWGPSGIGKTTIARFLFDQISSRFHCSAFMEDVKGSYPTPCFDEYNAQLQLQNKMLSKMINNKDIKISHLGVVKTLLRNQTVLLVLDGVDRLAQLDALAKDVTWFGPGSRIIITTQNLRILYAHRTGHIYKLKYPSTSEALQNFCLSAFDQKYPKDGFAELAHEITSILGELPLALKVMGSHFRGLSKEEWSMEVSKLRTTLNGEIECILKISFDALYDKDKDLFLHIACFFNKTSTERVEEYLAKSFRNVRAGLRMLAEKSLISINYNFIDMHHLLVQLGKEIVRNQSLREPGQRQFLVNDEDIHKVFIDNTTITRSSVIGIDSKLKLNITEKAFEGLSNLEFLRVSSDSSHPNIISSSGPLTFISPTLRLLDWSFFPMTCLPNTFNPQFLIELSMVNSNLEKLWDGIKRLGNLKRMYLSNSINLKELPDLSRATSLRELDLSGCSSLVELPSSIENATNLYKLYLSGCSSLLVSLPKLPDSLRFLDCSFCNPRINCSRVNQEARDLIIQRSNLKSAVLPGGEIPECVTYRAAGSSVTVKLNQKPLCASTKLKFKVCFSFVNKVGKKVGYMEDMSVSCSITSKQNALTTHVLSLDKFLVEHLYIFDVEAKEVTSTELVFKFEIVCHTQHSWEIKECGIFHLLVHHVDEDNECFKGGDEAIIEKMASESIDEDDEILENHVDEEFERFKGGDEAIIEKIASEVATKKSLKKYLQNILMKKTRWRRSDV